MKEALGGFPSPTERFRTNWGAQGDLALQMLLAALDLAGEQQQLSPIFVTSRCSGVYFGTEDIRSTVDLSVIVELSSYSCASALGGRSTLDLTLAQAQACLPTGEI